MNEWFVERGMDDAPIHYTADQAHAWAAGWNAAVRACIEDQDRALAAETPVVSS
jgi:hypothetical protein